MEYFCSPAAAAAERSLSSSWSRGGAASVEGGGIHAEVEL